MSRSLHAAAVATTASLIAFGVGDASAQSLLQRSPNLAAGWVGTPGALEVDASIRYDAIDGAELLPLPTVLAAYGLPYNLLAGANLATLSPVAPGQTTEFEPFVRWAPIVERADRPLQIAAQLAFNTASVSLDGEAEAGYRVGFARLLAAVRLITSGYDDDTGLAAAAGLVVQPLRGRVPLALSGDLGVLSGVDRGEDVTWSVGAQAGLPVTTSTVSLQVTNATSGTIEGRSLGTDDVRFGVELTVASPIGELLGVFVPREVAARAVQPVDAPDGAIVRVDIREFAFVGERIVIPAGATVVWTNRDEVVHTATSDDGAWNSGAIEPGESWSARFDERGVYSYHCSPHPYMRGSIVVR